MTYVEKLAKLLCCPVDMGDYWESVAPAGEKAYFTEMAEQLLRDNGMDATDDMARLLAPHGSVDWAQILKAICKEHGLRIVKDHPA